MKFLLFLFRLGLGVAVIGFTLIAFGALFGFIHPLLDALNHLQPIWFFGTLALLLLAQLFFRKKAVKERHLRWQFWHNTLRILSVFGFLASAVIVLPEQIAGRFVSKGRLSGQQAIKIMSHNLFGLNYDMIRMADIIHREDPDIIAFQEYFIEQRSRLHPLIIGAYPYFSTCAGRKSSHVALYSKIPFETQAGTQCTADSSLDNNSVARLVAKFSDQNGTSFSVVTTHLNWPVQINPIFRNELSTGQKLEALTARKREEWQDLSAAITSIGGPLILVGDFNSTSWSYAMGQFTSQNNLTRHSRGLLTYPKLLYIRGWRELPAFLPIDHLMASKDVRVQLVRVGETTGSDHLPIYGQFLVRQITP